MLDYEIILKFFDLANHIFIDQIQNIDYKNISDYANAEYAIKRVPAEFKLVVELIERQDLISAATVLRETFENIIYIIATSYDKNIKIKANTKIERLRNVVKESSGDIFASVDGDVFDYMYKYLCKIVHPCSIKEMCAYIENEQVVRIYALNCIKYVLLMLEYIYLDFVYKKANLGMELNDAVLTVVHWVNIYNGIQFSKNAGDSLEAVKKFFTYDQDSEYIKTRQEEVMEFGQYVKDNPEEFEEIRNTTLADAAAVIEKSNYKELLNQYFSSCSRRN